MIRLAPIHVSIDLIGNQIVFMQEDDEEEEGKDWNVLQPEMD